MFGPISYEAPEGKINVFLEEKKSRTYVRDNFTHVRNNYHVRNIIMRHCNSMRHHNQDTSVHKKSPNQNLFKPIHGLVIIPGYNPRL